MFLLPKNPPSIPFEYCEVSLSLSFIFLLLFNGSCLLLPFNRMRERKKGNNNNNNNNDPVKRRNSEAKKPLLSKMQGKAMRQKWVQDLWRREKEGEKKKDGKKNVAIKLGYQEMMKMETCDLGENERRGWLTNERLGVKEVSR